MRPFNQKLLQAWVMSRPHDQNPRVMVQPRYGKFWVMVVPEGLRQPTIVRDSLRLAECEAQKIGNRLDAPIFVWRSFDARRP